MIERSTVPFGIIRNVSLIVTQGKPTTINGTCDECLCALVSNASLFSLNFFSENLTCEMYSKVDQNKFFSLVDSVASAFYFVSLPTYVGSSSTSGLTTEQSITLTSKSFSASVRVRSIFLTDRLYLVTPTTVEYLWTFDSTFQDLSAIFTGLPMGGANFSSNSITGYGLSLSLSRSKSQYLLIPDPQLKLYNQSWTFEAWIYLAENTSDEIHTIIGQCRNASTDTCLHLAVRNHKLYLGFFNDDLSGNTNLTELKWYHVAYAFDYDTCNQSVYLDGIIDGSRQANTSFQGYNQSLTFGSTYASGPLSCFDGLIDQLSFTNRAKNSTEILQDATLVVYFSFDNNSTYDEGPLRINGSHVGNTTFVPGRVGQALEIKNINQSDFSVHGLVLLGISNRSYSFSIWIRPYIQQKSTILHLSDQMNGTNWCVPALGLTNTGQLMSYSYGQGTGNVVGPVVPINTWNHAAVTYSNANGLRLYVNGTLNSSSTAFSFSSGGAPMYLFVSSPISGIGCVSMYDTCGQYSGAVDELRVYSRELSPGDVAFSANQSLPMHTMNHMAGTNPQ